MSTGTDYIQLKIIEPSMFCVKLTVSLDSTDKLGHANALITGKAVFAGGGLPTSARRFLHAKQGMGLKRTVEQWRAREGGSSVAAMCETVYPSIIPHSLGTPKVHWQHPVTR